MSKHRSNRGGLVPGLIMIVIGSLFLLERMDFLPIGRVWQFWPMILIVMGLSHLLAPGRGRRSIFLLLMGIWLQISVLRLWGLDFGDSWPILLIFIGVSIIFDTYFGRPGSNSDFVFHADIGGPERGAGGARSEVHDADEEVSQMGDELGEAGEGLSGGPEQRGEDR